MGRAAFAARPVCWPVRRRRRPPAASATRGGSTTRRLYELAIKAATEARDAGERVDEASLIIARAHLERFRQTRDAHNLTEAQEALRAVDATPLVARGATPSSRWRWASGCSWTTSSARPPSCSTAASASVDDLGPVARDRVLDWWATADRSAGAGRSRAPRGALPAHHRPDGGGAARAARLDRGRLLAGGRGAIASATPSAPGTRRWRDTCARGSPPTAAPRCAPTSTGWSPPRSSPSVRAS